MTTRIRTGAVVLTCIVLAAYGYFSVQYGTLNWVGAPPPELSVESRDYRLSNLPASPDLPSAADVDWYPKHHMWPLGYDIFWPRGYETSTGVILKWRDDLYYQYSLQGGP